MFTKNTLFLKIILIFTLPALGILFFSSILVYEKFQSFNELDEINNNLIYLKNTEKLIDSLQKERESTVIDFLQKNNKTQLDENRTLSLQNFKNLEISLANLNFENKISQLKSQTRKLEQFRIKVDKSNVTIDEIFEEYNEFNKILLDSLAFLKPIKSAFDFNNEFRNILHFLHFKESTYIERTMLISYFIENKINDKLYNLFIKNYSLQEINKNYFLNNTNLEIIQKYNSKPQEDYFSKIFIIRNNVKNKNFSNFELTLEEWDNVSNENLESLSNIYKIY